VTAWVNDEEFSERLDAYSNRFSRLQDTVGDKLLPAVLILVGEPVKTNIDNLDRAERFGWLNSADEWLALRQLRNKFVHEYIEDIETLVDAIIVSRDGVSTLISFGRNLIGETESRLGQAK
jgi:hypothetical protein